MMEEWNDYRRVHNLFVMNSLMKMIHRTVDEKHRTSERETNQFRTQKSQSAYSSVLPIGFCYLFGWSGCFVKVLPFG